GFPKVNGVYVVSTTGPTFSPTELTSDAQFPAPANPGDIGANGNILGITVDVADGIVFFETNDNTGGPHNALWWLSASGGANQTTTKVTLPAGVTFNFAGQTPAGQNAPGLSFDPVLKQIYLS